MFRGVKKCVKFVLAVPLPVNIALLISIFTLTLLVLLKTNIQLHSELYSVLYRLSLSIISSYVFYFIVVHIKSQRDKKNIHRVIDSYINRILTDYRFQKNGISRSVDFEFSDEFPKLEEIKECFSQVLPYGEAPLYNPQLGRSVTWLDCFYSLRNKSCEAIEKILRKSDYIDSKLVSILDDIENNNHFAFSKVMPNLPHRNESLENWAEGFLDYTEKVKKLHEYRVKEIEV